MKRQSTGCSIFRIFILSENDPFTGYQYQNSLYYKSNQFQLSNDGLAKTKVTEFSSISPTDIWCRMTFRTSETP